ncbi:acetate kinase [Candidatus Woesearchaeota archaeon]|nr:acetate kinase [Candidatus Woesearchaeota archaeon]
MQHILILNIGSSSIKYTLFDNETPVLKGYMERVSDYDQGIRQIIAEIEIHKLKVDAIGHRVVHGGTHSKPVLINANKIKELENISELAPLHNIPEVTGIKICMKLFNAPQVAVFDTAFHHTIPEKAYTYAIPSSIAKKYKIRRYGFHGTSHKYVSHEAAKMMSKPIGKTKIITCHLGNGCSISAIKNGKSIETSMGFTPLEGLVMGTRSGDIDPAIVTFIQNKEKINSAMVEKMLNKESGLLGICGMTDMRDIYESNKKEARLAEDVFCHRAIKYIGAYAAAMDGVDSIVFTGGIGEHAWWIRDKILSNLRYLGVRYSRKNNKSGKPRISSFSSRVWVFVISTNEELMMCRETRKLIWENRK